MPFGRYKGYELDALPHDYLGWLIGLPDLRRLLRAAVEAEADRRRAETNMTGTLTRFNHEERVVASELIAAGRRVLAQKYHPDRGGDMRTMQRVNHTADVLRDLVLK